MSQDPHEPSEPKEEPHHERQPQPRQHDYSDDEQPTQQFPQGNQDDAPTQRIPQGLQPSENTDPAAADHHQQQSAPGKEPGQADPAWQAGAASYPGQPLAAQGEHQQAGHNPWTQPAEPTPQKKQKRRGIGAAGFTVGVILAGLLGGGVVLGGQALMEEDSEEVSVSDQGVEINSPEATAVTAAADQAAPSVVTLSVAGQGGSGSGSGIILDDEGHVLTNTHVVTLGGAEAEPEIQVQLNDGRVTTAEIVGTDPLSDLAVIQLADANDLNPADLGSSNDLNVGDQTIAIGAPLSLAGTVTTGIVSTLDRTIQVASSAVEPDEIQPDSELFEDLETEEELPDDEGGFEFFFPDQEEAPTQGSIYLNVIQTDAAINQGNSGGALVDSEGQVIGVNVAIASAGGGMMGEAGAGSIGVGFAIPIEYAQRVASELIENGEASHGLLGVEVMPAYPDSEANQDLLNAGEGQTLPPMGFSAGGLVTGISGDSPAAEAGLEEGDVIEEVEGRRIEDGVSLTATVREFGNGETITLTVLREGERQEIDVTLAGM